MSKILERAVQQQLVNHLESHNLFSTQSAITDSIRRNMDAGQLTGAIFVDFRKAFDTIDHKIMLDKLQLFGIRDNGHLWMSDYLTDRTQSVFIEGVLSRPQKWSPEFRKVPYWALCYFLCMSQICQTVYRLPMY